MRWGDKAVLANAPEERGGRARERGPSGLSTPALTACASVLHLQDLQYFARTFNSLPCPGLQVAGPPRMVRGERCVDAAVFEPVPVASAVRDGCTHVLVLCTRPAASAGGATTVRPRASGVAGWLQ